MTHPNWVPERGDIVWLDFNPQAGHERAGRRPAVILSPSSYNALFGLALVCPITNQVKGYLWEWPLPDDSRTTGVILTDQVRNMDWRSRRAELAERLPPDEMKLVLEAARRLLDEP